MPRTVLALRSLLACAAALAATSAAAAPLLDLSRTAISWGRVASGVDILQPVFLTNVGDAPLNLSGLALSGRNATDYRTAGTCGVPSVLAPGDRCRVDIIAAIQGASSSATLTVESDSAAATNSVILSGIAAADLVHGLFATPPFIDFDRQALGTTAAMKTLTITNPEASTLALFVDGVALVGPAASDFTMISDCVVGRSYANNASCSATIGFTPSANGPRSAELEFRAHPSGQAAGFVTARYSVTGVGGAIAPVTVVEYYNAVLDHYFITWLANEQANLDAGNTPTKWNRTGYSFRAFTTAQTGTSPVCRYYLPPEFGDSHFFGRGTAECNATGAAHPQFVLEDPQFMQMFLPVAGSCPAGTVPIYRVFSNRPDANHRYMTDRSVRDQMVAKGWLAEGDGPDLVVMCAP